MKVRLLLLSLAFGMCIPSFAQSEVDVTKLLADTKTFIFNNNKNTVKGYIYSQLEEITTCCGSDRIYLEVKIDPSGYVLQVKPLTGKIDCFKQSAADIVKNIKWDASSFKGPKSVYFEIKPNIDCNDARNNTYAQIEIFNNEMISQDGTVAAATRPPATTTTAPATTTTTSTPATTPATTSTPPRTTTEAVTPPKTEATTSPKPPVKEIATSEKPKTTPAVTSKPTTPPATTKSDPVTLKAETTPMTSTAQPNAITSPANEEELRKQREVADATRAAQEEEIRRLKEQMERLRQQEETARQNRLAQERERKEQERRREEQLASSSYEDESSSSSSDEGSGGGLFLDEPSPSSSSSGGYEEERGRDREDRGSESSSMNDDERFREDLRRLEQQKRDLEVAKRERENAQRRQQQEDDRANRELLKIEEEIVRKGEENAQRREQQELDRLEQDRRRAEDARRKEEEEYQRMMGEIQRLQDEAQRKIADLERQKQDLDQLAATKQAREQEMILERSIRKAENERKMEEMRLRLLNTGPNVAVAAANPGVNSSAMGTTAFPIPDMTAKADSEKLKILTATINNLYTEMQRLQEQIRLMQTAGGGALPTPTTGTPGGSVDPRSAPSNLTKADSDQSWKNIDIKDPNAPADIYVTVQDNLPPPPKDGGDKKPHPSHKGTFKNVTGPKFETREYVDGKDAMKNVIKESLRNAGVCGLGQSLFSVTLDPSGKVINHAILAANNPLVQAQMSLVVPSLKFNSVDTRYRQTIYLEFKAEVLCDGVTDKVNLKDVETILKDE